MAHAGGAFFAARNQNPGRADRPNGTRKMNNPEALKLPDALLVRYYRQGEIEVITAVVIEETRVIVVLDLADHSRTDHWRDLGGGLGYVPDSE
jgi:hypothetical protein